MAKMDGHFDHSRTTKSVVESEPALAPKNLRVGSRKETSSSPLGILSLVPLAVAAATLIVFLVIRSTLASRVDPVDSIDLVDSGGVAVSSTTHSSFSSFLLLDKPVKGSTEQIGIDGILVRDCAKACSQSFAGPSGSCKSGHSSAHQVKHVIQYDDWSLSTLEYFEGTLPLELQQGKAAIAAWAAEFYTSSTAAQSVDNFQRVICEGIWDKAVGSFVGMVLVLRGVRPLKLEDEIRHLPHMLRVTKVAAALPWGLLLHVEDADTTQEFTLQIPLLAESATRKFGVENFLEIKREAFQSERNTEIQACGNISAELTGSLKGFLVSLYTAEIAGVFPVCFADGTYIFNRALLLEKVQGNLKDLKIRAPDVMTKAQNYIASRLLQIVLKLEQAGIGHLAIDWDSVFLREDGSFLLGNFGSSAPFGRPIVSDLISHSDQLEPGILVAAEDTSLSPAPGGNMWSLGILLFQLYTGKDNPYGTATGNSPRDAAANLANGLLSKDIRSYVLVYELTAANVPSRWKQLILRLLEPRSANRINGFEVTREFPDLISHFAQ